MNPEARASAILGLNRATLRYKLRALGLAVEKVLVDQPGTEGAPLGTPPDHEPATSMAKK